MLSGSEVTPAARFVRGWFCAALATLLAAASHVLAGGTVPFLAAALSVSVGALVCVVLAGRRLTLARAASGVAVSQLAFHSLFEVFANTPGSSPALTPHQHEIGASVASAATHIQPTTMTSGAEASMLLSHLVAGLLTVVIVRHGENVWWALLAILTATVTVVFRLVTLCPVGGAFPRTLASPAVAGLLKLLHCGTRLRLRGPPQPVLALA
jgi:hypothetical protein